MSGGTRARAGSIEPSGRANLLNLGLIAAIGVVITAGVWPIHAGDPPIPSGVACIKNLRKLDLAVTMYSQDHDDRFPNAGSWMDAVSAYQLGGNPYCPSIQGADPHAYGYAMNRALSGVEEQSVPDPGSTALVFDSPLLYRNASSGAQRLPTPPRHEGRNCIGYADGHARGVSPKDQPAKPAVAQRR